jgi:hypothetical protein
MASDRTALEKAALIFVTLSTLLSGPFPAAQRVSPQQPQVDGSIGRGIRILGGQPSIPSGHRSLRQPDPAQIGETGADRMPSAFRSILNGSRDRFGRSLLLREDVGQHSDKPLTMVPPICTYWQMFGPLEALDLNRYIRGDK